MWHAARSIFTSMASARCLMRWSTAFTSIRSVTLVDVRGTAAPPLQQIEDNLLRVMTVLSENRDMTRDRAAHGRRSGWRSRPQNERVLRALADAAPGALVKGCAMGLLGAIDPEIVSQAALGGLKEVALQWIVRRESDAETLRRVCRGSCPQPQRNAGPHLTR